MNVVTTADRAAQEIYVRMIREGFPTYGLVAEEDALSIRCTDPELVDIYFTVDPLDGTKAFRRRQSHGIGTMLSLVHKGEIIAAYVGDVMTREIYGYHPGTDKVQRLHAFSRAQPLKPQASRKLQSQFVLLRERPEKYSPLVRKMIAPPSDGGLFRNIEVTGGSIGITMARLWKSEVGGLVMQTRHSTPWDVAPVAGICQRLGFVFLESDPEQGRLVVRPPIVREYVEHGAREQVIIHERRLPELEEWQRRTLSLT